MFPTSPKKLERYLRYLGASPQKKWGQNFLIENKHHCEIAKAASLSKDDVVLEIGPGLGHLTYFIQPLVSKLWLAEIDPIMIKALTESFKEATNIEIINIDVLEKKKCLNSALLEKVQPFLENKQLKIVANLPYNISAPVIVNFLKLVHKPSLVILTVQKEIAERLVATHSTEFYGPLTIQTQLRSRVRILHSIPPQAFFPQPKVTSAVIEVTPDDHWEKKVKNIEILEKLVHATFCLRRKKISNSLVHSGFLQKGKTYREIEEKFDLSRRPETFSLEEFISLANMLENQEIV